MDKQNRIKIIRLGVLCGLILLTVLLFANRHRIQEFYQYGYAGVFMVSILSNATIVFPIPGVVFTSVMGAVFNPFWVAIAAGCGAALGELTGYAAGYNGQFMVENKEWYDKVTGWMSRYGNLTVLVMAIIPNPFFDLAGISAGVLKMPVLNFLVWCVAGKIIKMLIFAYTGSSMFQLFGN